MVVGAAINSDGPVDGVGGSAEAFCPHAANISSAAGNPAATADLPTSRSGNFSEPSPSLLDLGQTAVFKIAVKA